MINIFNKCKRNRKTLPHFIYGGNSSPTLVVIILFWMFYAIVIVDFPLSHLTWNPLLAQQNNLISNFIKWGMIWRLSEWISFFLFLLFILIIHSIMGYFYTTEWDLKFTIWMLTEAIYRIKSELQYELHLKNNCNNRLPF